jgi:hypothetical protein
MVIATERNSYIRNSRKNIMRAKMVVRAGSAKFAFSAMSDEDEAN